MTSAAPNTPPLAPASLSQPPAVAVPPAAPPCPYQQSALDALAQAARSVS